MSSTFALQAREHGSTVLDRWLAGREGGHARAGVQPMGAALAGDHAVGTLTGSDLVKVLGLNAATASGQVVTPDTAMRVSAVYGCISLLAGAISTMPFGIYERKDGERSRVEHDYHWWLNESANDEMTSSAAWEYLVASKLFYGDGFGELLRPSYFSSRVIGLQPHHPLDVQPFRDDQGVKRYRVWDPVTGKWRVLDMADMIQLPSLGFDGLRSPSPITYAAREAIGVALGAEKYTAQFFGGGATFDYALSTDSRFDPGQLEALMKSLMAAYTISGNSRAPLMLTGGLKPAQLTINQKDAEVLATRLFTVEEICRIFGVPPFLVGHTQKSTSWGTGLEATGAAFVRYTLQRHLTPMGQELNRKLWPTRARYFVEHITAALERGDIKSRYEAYRIALGRAGEQPFIDVDEVRRLENMAPNPKLSRNPDAKPGDPEDPGADNAP